MNLKLFLLINACKDLPSEIIENIWSSVKTDAKKSIQERIQKLYYKKIERSRRMFLMLDGFSKDNPFPKLNTVFNRIQNYAKITNYMYIQDVDRFIRCLYIIKGRYCDYILSGLIDQVVFDITRDHLIGKARMARILALRKCDYKVSTKKYIRTGISPVMQRILSMINSSSPDIKISGLYYILKYYLDNINININDYNNPLESYNYLIAKLPVYYFNHEHINDYIHDYINDYINYP
jgi:hypothetical protein